VQGPFNGPAAPGASAGKVCGQGRAGSGFGTAAVGDLQRGLQQGMVDPLAHLRVQPFHAFGQLTACPFGQQRLPARIGVGGAARDRAYG
jgi:hypothetical protein